MWKVDFILENGKIRIKSNGKQPKLDVITLQCWEEGLNAPTGQSQDAMSPSPSAPNSEVDDDLPF